MQLFDSEPSKVARSVTAINRESRLMPACNCVSSAKRFHAVPLYMYSPDVNGRELSSLLYPYLRIRKTGPRNPCALYATPLFSSGSIHRSGPLWAHASRRLETQDYTRVARVSLTFFCFCRTLEAQERTEAAASSCSRDRIDGLLQQRPGR